MPSLRQKIFLIFLTDAARCSISPVGMKVFELESGLSLILISSN